MQNTQQNVILEITEAQYQELVHLQSVFENPAELRKEMWQLIVDATNNKELDASFSTRPTDHIFNMMKVTEILSALFEALPKTKV